MERGHLVGARLYRLSLRAFPAPFRSRFGAELLAAFEAEYRALHGWARARFFVRALLDTLWSGASERLAGGGPRPGGGALTEGALSAVRTFRRFPHFTAVVVVTLSLGIGANLTIFGVADRLLLSAPDHVVDPDGVVQLHFRRVSPFTGLVETSGAFAYPDFEDMLNVAGFEAVAGFGNSQRTLGSGDDAERIRVQSASASLFGLLGVRPALGRFFSAEEDRIEGATPTVVLSHAFWNRRFAADPSVLGRTLRIGRGTYTVVGVAPPAFTGPSAAPVDVWLPLLTSQAIEVGTQGWPTSRRWYWFSAVARLGADAQPESALAQATSAHRAGRVDEVIAGRYDESAEAVFGSLVPGRSPNAGPEAKVSVWLVGVSVVVLLIACANVANLLFLRAIRRRRELAVRVALGSSRGRLATLLLTESLALACLAGVGALLAARWGGALIYRALLPDLDPGTALAGPRMMVYAGGVVVVATVLAGVLPALHASRPDLAGDLKEGGRGATASGRTRAALLTLQVSLSVALLVVAGLFLRSLSQVRALDLGFDPEGLVVAWLETDGGTFNDESSLAVQTAVDRLRGQPGVGSVASASLAPFSGLLGLTLLRAPGDTVEVSRGPFFYVASTDYFATMGMRITRGRGFLDGDAAEGAPPVAVLTEDLARRVFGSGDPLNQCVYVEPGDDEPPLCTRVVGLLRDHRSYALEEPETLVFYLPLGHPSAEQPPQALIVRADGPPAEVIPLVRSTLLSATPSARFASVSLLSETLDQETRSWRLGATLFTLFGTLALTVASLGLYALVAFDVAIRRRELGVRAALGAGRQRLIGQVVASTLARTAGGVVIGLLLGVSLAYAGRALLFSVEPADPIVLAGSCLLLLGVATLAALQPALSASRVSPTEALHAE